MATFPSFAPPQGITLPMQPKPRMRGTLDTVAADLAAADFESARSAAGVEWLPWGEIVISVDDVTCETVYAKDPRDLPEIATQPGFMMFDSILCSTLGLSLEQLAHRIRTNLTEFISMAVTRELVTATLSGGVGLQGNATYAPLRTSNTATTLAVALSNLQTNLNTVQPGAQFTIHLTPGLLDIGVAQGLIVVAGDHYETPSGHLVHGDAGILGTDVPHGGNALSAGEVWIYASGRIYYHTSPIKGVEVVDQADGGAVYIPQNKHKPLVERTGLIVFDPNVLAAAKVTVAL